MFPYPLITEYECVILIFENLSEKACVHFKSDFKIGLLISMILLSVLLDCPLLLLVFLDF